MIAPLGNTGAGAPSCVAACGTPGSRVARCGLHPCRWLWPCAVDPGYQNLDKQQAHQQPPIQSTITMVCGFCIDVRVMSDRQGRRSRSRCSKKTRPSSRRPLYIHVQHVSAVNQWTGQLGTSGDVHLSRSLRRTFGRNLEDSAARGRSPPTCNERNQSGVSMITEEDKGKDSRVRTSTSVR